MLLLRGRALAGDWSDVADTGYFDLPRFAVGFREDPTLLLTRRLLSHFGQRIDHISVLGVHQCMIDADTVQEFEIVYRVTGEGVTDDMEKEGVYFFADMNTVHEYMLQDRYQMIQRYLDM